MKQRPHHKLTPTRLLMADTTLPRLTAEEFSELQGGSIAAQPRKSGGEASPRRQSRPHHGLWGE